MPGRRSGDTAADEKDAAGDSPLQRRIRQSRILLMNQ